MNEHIYRLWNIAKRQYHQWYDDYGEAIPYFSYQEAQKACVEEPQTYIVEKVELESILKIKDQYVFQ